MVLAELAGGVTLVLEQIGDGYRFRLQSLRSRGYADLRQASAINTLPGNE